MKNYAIISRIADNAIKEIGIQASRVVSILIGCGKEIDAATFIADMEDPERHRQFYVDMSGMKRKKVFKKHIATIHSLLGDLSLSDVIGKDKVAELQSRAVSACLVDGGVDFYTHGEKPKKERFYRNRESNLSRSESRLAQGNHNTKQGWVRPTSENDDYYFLNKEEIINVKVNRICPICGQRLYFLIANDISHKFLCSECGRDVVIGACTAQEEEM